MISIILMIIFGVFKAAQDTLSAYFTHSIFSNFNAQFWNRGLSWKNKYKDRDYTKGPRFFLSTTVFVFLTDGWHLTQFVWINSAILAIVLYKPLFSLPVDFVIISVTSRAMFELCYGHLFKKRVSK